MKVSLFSTLMLKHFIYHDNFDVQLDGFDIPKSYLFLYLQNINKMTKKLTDLKLTIYTHRLKDTYFLIPDQYVIVISPNNCKFSDKDLKMYFPISSNIVLCFERVSRSFSKGLCFIDKSKVEEFNLFFASNSFESFGCENETYLNEFLERNTNIISPLKRNNPDTDFIEEIEQIKIEIIRAKLFNFNFGNIVTNVNSDNEFKIHTKEEFESLEKTMNPVHKINKISIRF